ncbi:MAG: nuclear transport factor 2 family protein, partial [Gammaproteobacteria bacterium]
MKKLATTIAASSVLLSTALGVSAQEHAADIAAIESLLSKYERALNASDTQSIIPLYAEDGVFMAQHNFPAVGTEALTAAYDAVFENIQLTVEFQIDEIVQQAPDWVFVRTQSAGKVFIKAAGIEASEGNQEL